METYIVYDREYTLQGVYALGRVPSAPITRLVTAYLASEGLSADVFAKVAGTNHKSIKGDNIPDTYEFDTADRLITRSWGPFMWQAPELIGHYNGVNLTGVSGDERVASGKCKNGHSRPEHGFIAKNGAVRCRICVQASAARFKAGKKSAAWNERRNSRRRVVVRQRSLTCKNGHERTPENVHVRNNGRRECLLCMRARGAS